jgi:hypothetical protein
MMSAEFSTSIQWLVLPSLDFASLLRVSIFGLKIKYDMSAYLKRLTRLSNSSDFPANIGPQITSIQPFGLLNAFNFISFSSVIH